MFAEGRFDIAHWLTSNDGIGWNEQGSLDIRYSNGKPLSPGPYDDPSYGSRMVFVGIWFTSGATEESGGPVRSTASGGPI